jgi:gliding motility-associated-like protein
VVVLIDPLVMFPNAFSPNNDGINDIFLPVVRGPVELDHFRVFNRWGELIFESNDITIGWDGSYNGKLQNMGAYVYVLSGQDDEGKQIKEQGNVLLVK